MQRMWERERERWRAKRSAQVQTGKSRVKPQGVCKEWRLKDDYFFLVWRLWKFLPSFQLYLSHTSSLRSLESTRGATERNKKHAICIINLACNREVTKRISSEAKRYLLGLMILTFTNQIALFQTWILRIFLNRNVMSARKHISHPSLITLILNCSNIHYNLRLHQSTLCQLGDRFVLTSFLVHTYLLNALTRSPALPESKCHGICWRAHLSDRLISSVQTDLQQPITLSEYPMRSR